MAGASVSATERRTGTVGQTIHQAVTWQARTRPDAVALIFKDERISYAVLDAAADAYAAELQRLGVGPGQLVPVLLKRSPTLVAVLLAVLKCGAAYSALDHRWPGDRRRAVVGALGAGLLVTDRPGAETGTPVWAPPTGGLPAAARSAKVPTATVVDASAAATVFFTSGTTGAPKGVVSPHRATTRLFDGRTFADFGRGRVTVQAAPVPWDAFSLELWGMLTTGGTSVIVDGDYLFPGELRGLVESAGVDTVWLTASLFNLFVDEDLDCFAGVRQVMTGGERLSVPHVRSFVGRHPQVSLLNGYGPVESCVFATTRAVRLADCDAPHGIPIGRPAPATAVHLLDGGALVADGVPGEICVAGDGLALGYLDNPGANAEKFVTTDLDGVPTRLYRTGDVACRDADGVLHYLGRADRQIKISGYRVEPAEIEHAALRLPGVRECAVLPVPVPGADGAWDRLALFYRGDHTCPEPSSLQGELAEVLPHYLVPPTVRRVDALPRSANGKLDQAVLLDLLASPSGDRESSA
ncbi:amino acid adenylation domain-containing protein [Kitasatospora sp. MAP5-34]|uniref:amino acid adenylation domain-containing protein n=1 Tax=Kitasatospora sp. MAP5-34 TaxID=3035102 RepID=UPI0024737EDC|nr:amino acid adenylation domain-containing protein [Kitasatospora sp. MAP5-34]MDH6578815.1 D-alanine--poly(phosphoribitol) ligase subunit 1 [Kitasatospora sp. MAP5-34]